MHLIQDQESQRDSVSKPRVASHALPWVVGPKAINPNGVAAGLVTPLAYIPGYPHPLLWHAVHSHLARRTQEGELAGTGRGADADGALTGQFNACALMHAARIDLEQKQL